MRQIISERDPLVADLDIPLTRLTAYGLGFADEPSEIECLSLDIFQLVQTNPGSLQYRPEGPLVLDQGFRMFLVPPYGESVRVEPLSLS